MFGWIASLFQRKPRMKSRALASLWQRVASISHPNHPFLDKDYSPDTQMPAADFTAWVAERFARDDWASIRELLGHLNHGHVITGLDKTFRSYVPPDFIAGDPDFIHELRAVTLLCHRVPWMGAVENRSHLLMELITHSLAAHPFNLQSTAKTRPPLVHQPGRVAVLLASYPITFRSCLAFAVGRDGQAAGMFRPDLSGDYTLRQYGLSSVENERFLKDCGLFGMPHNVAGLAARLQKDDLIGIAAKCGVECLKSWKKDRMVAAVIESPAAAPLILATAPKGMLHVRQDLAADFSQWLDDLHGLQDAAKRLIRG